MAENTPGREAVGIFHDPKMLQSAIDDLLSSGFDRADLSFLASRGAVEEKLRYAYRSVRELEDEPGVPTVAVSTAGAIIASGGTVAAAIATAVVAGTGGAALGAMLDRFIDNKHLRRIEEQLIRGGFLLWVRTFDAQHESRAVDILKRNRGDHVHVHDLSLAVEAAADMRRKMSELVDEAGRESFPASDAPAFTSSIAGSPRQ